jgi:hypothetical protein
VLIPFTASDVFETTVQGIVPVTDNGGSDISTAFSLMNQLYSQHDRPIRAYLLSDGGDAQSDLIEKLPKHITLSIIGIGTDAG